MEIGPKAKEDCPINQRRERLALNGYRESAYDVVLQDFVLTFAYQVACIAFVGFYLFQGFIIDAVFSSKYEARAAGVIYPPICFV